MKRKDLVFWLAPRYKIPPYTRNKHWGIIHAFNRSKKRPQVYLVSDTSGTWVDIDELEATTVEKVIRYQRDHYKQSAKETRSKIEEAQFTVESL